MQGRQTGGYLVTFAGGEADIDVVPALYLPLAVPLHLFTSDALGRTN